MTKATPEQWQSFYKNVAYAAYAVAAADRKVSSAEVDALQQQIKENWLSIEDTADEFGTDAAYQVEIVFDWLREENPGSDEALKVFAEYVEKAEGFLSDELRMQIVHLSNKIAVSFHGANKSELAVLLKIQQLLFKA